jgi:hypothetical protein
VLSWYLHAASLRQYKLAIKPAFYTGIAGNYEIKYIFIGDNQIALGAHVDANNHHHEAGKANKKLLMYKKHYRVFFSNEELVDTFYSHKK